ncbi:AI-2E family transporter [Candidatus Saccharibacteria bacterium]|nr:AI-2E family transporter [Candidatus Saccharibacteria bacterium]
MEKHYEITPKTVLFTLAVLTGLWILVEVRMVVVALFIALILSLALDPLVAKLKGLKIPRPIGVFLVFFVFLAAIVGLLTYGFTPLVNQTGRFLVNLPRFLEPVLERFASIPFTESLQQQLVSQATILSANILTVAGSIVSNAVLLVTILVFTFYFLLDWENIRNRFVGMMNKKAQSRSEKIIGSMEQQLGGWLRGQVLLMLAVGVLTYLGLFALGVEYALPLAVIAGVFEIIPTIGPIIAAIPGLLVGFGTSPLMGLWILILYIIVQQLENNILVPNVMGRTAGFSPLGALIILFIGAQLFGIVGLLLAIPAAIMLSILAKDVLQWNHVSRRR